MRAVPVVFVVYDLLERRRRSTSARRPLVERRRGAAARSSPGGVLRLSEEVVARRPGTTLAALRAGVARARRRRLHPQTPRLGVRRRPPQGRVVEVEDRSADGGRRAHLRAAGERPPRKPAHRLHLRRLGRRASSCRSRKPTRDFRMRRSKSSTSGSAGIRGNGMARSARRAGPGLRARVRGDRAPRRATRAESPFAFHECCAGGRTNPPRKPTRLDSSRKLVDRSVSTLLATGAAGIARCELIWVVTFTLLAGSAVLPAREPSVASNPIASFFSRAEQPLHQYRALRRMHATSDSGKYEAWLDAWTELKDGRFSYRDRVASAARTRLAARCSGRCWRASRRS